MRGPVRDYFQGDAITLGITIKDKLNAHTNPTNGVKVNIKNADGDTLIAFTAMTQARYNEDDTSTAGQFFYNFQSSDTMDTGNYKVTFLIDDSGTFEGVKVFDPFFRLLDA